MRCKKKRISLDGTLSLFGEDRLDDSPDIEPLRRFFQRLLAETLPSAWQDSCWEQAQR